MRNSASDTYFSVWGLACSCVRSAADSASYFSEPAMSATTASISNRRRSAPRRAKAPRRAARRGGKPSSRSPYRRRPQALRSAAARPGTPAGATKRRIMRTTILSWLDIYPKHIEKHPNDGYAAAGESSGSAPAAGGRKPEKGCGRPRTGSGPHFREIASARPFARFFNDLARFFKTP